MSFNDKIVELKKTIPFRFRIGSGMGKPMQVGDKKVYPKYMVLPYIDARDCMDRLDFIFGGDWKRDHYEVAGKSYCAVSLFNGRDWISRSDVGEPTAISKNK
jgi:hypothetical protein